VCPFEFRSAQWEFLNGEVVEFFSTRIYAAPTLPGCEEVQAGSKSGFQYCEGRISPSFWQLVSGQEDVAALREAIVAGVINVLKLP
jgi:hypothetical protein